MPGKCRIAAKSALSSAMRWKIASRVSFLPTITSIVAATPACTTDAAAERAGKAAERGDAARAVPAGVSATGALATGASAGSACNRGDGTIAAEGEVVRATYQTTSRALTAAIHGTQCVINFLNELDIFEVPRLLRRTRNILAIRPLSLPAPPNSVKKRRPFAVSNLPPA